MFTGLIEMLATVDELRPEPHAVRLTVRAAAAAHSAQIGDSVALAGCCLTVVAVNGDQISFQAGSETLRCTNLGQLQPGSPVNLERALIVGDRLGGHLVTGHVDGLGTLLTRRDEQDWSHFWFNAPAALLRQMAPKGSITVDGVSLTLVEVESDRFSVALIPHTLTATTLGRLAPGDEVNLETDVIAKYVEKQVLRSDER